MSRFLPINDVPSPPVRGDLGIALVGCGGIVNSGHLPAYRAHNLNLVGCFDQDADSAKSTAERFRIPIVYDSLAALLADPAVTIVDIAVRPNSQPDVALQCFAAGKHVLCQKPLALTTAEANRVVNGAEQHQRKAAVNQQMRWSGAIAAASQIVQSGYTGQLTDLQINVSVKTPWHLWPWLRDSDQLEVMYHSIHYLDAIRFLAGDPILITSRHSLFPGQPERAETKTITVLDYADGCQSLVAVNHHDESGGVHARFRLLGTEGVIEGNIGLLATYPDGGLDTIRARRTDDPPGQWHSPILTTLWMPDAFIGPMASLINAIVSDTEPLTSVRDNLNTIRIVTAAYQSMAESRTVSLAEIVP